MAQIVQGATTGRGATVYYVLPQGIPVTVHPDGRPWCGQCPAQRADRCRHAKAVASHLAQAGVAR